ncbi:hypothetical protein SCMU_40900 [Sinomonas cyclohexanicum]|uniref:Transposase n=1 Tax=Sinomonas cyclohexanicum TaxID=322009 RepID=A0ABN6FS04_SINCY|nr:hypothetical protein SCMU_40900 [Corynebacterium cyclohexanicum]
MVAVAWIRRVRTASGATAVQIAESVDGRRRIVAHVGSAHTEAELGLLVERARELLDDPGQGELDLGLAPAAPRTALIGPPGEPALFENPGTAVPGRSAVAPPRVVATASRVLFDTLAAVFDDLGFDALADEVFRDLVVARIVEPTSILDTARVLGDLGVRRRARRRCGAPCPARTGAATGTRSPGRASSTPRPAAMSRCACTT